MYYSPIISLESNYRVRINEGKGRNTMVREQDEFVPLSKLFDLSGKGAMVTGGARGIGFGIARRLAEAGADVLIADVDTEEAKLAVQKLGSYGFKAIWTKCDVTKKTEVKSAIKTAISTLGNLNILVNNAGIYPFKNIFDATDAEWDKVIAINLKGTYLCAREASHQMIKRKQGGCIINIGSTSSVKPSRFGLVHYTASKGGVLMLTKSLAREFAPYGIRVNVIAPGGIPTAPTQSNQPSVLTNTQETNTEFLQRVPLGRPGRPDDIGTAALFLASEASSYMTGSLVVVDGGYLLS
ncbi:SDR family NAD(P)-dependent oxidoreductase [Chloroflexota bacterium]